MTGEADVLASDLRRALSETGAIGATVRQLSRRVDGPMPRVAAELERLSGLGEVARMGRGLWVLSDFETLSERDDFVDPAEYVERFERENGVALSTYDGPITSGDNERRPVHRWWPYVQGYSAEFVEDVLARGEIGPGSTVLDPFAGSGTTLVEARRAGARAIGVEMLPPAALAARTKCCFELDPLLLRRAGDRWLARARTRPPGALPFLRETRRHFDPAVARDLTRLRDSLPGKTGPVADALRLSFGRVLIPVSRLRRAPCLGYATVVHRGPGPFDRVEATIREMGDDLRGLQAERPRWGPPATVLEEDARSVALPPGSVDLAVTSPPYVNGMDYVMNYKLDLAWLGYAHSYADLAALRHVQVACDNLPRDEAARYGQIPEAPDRWLRPILTRIRENVRRKGSYRRDDVHGIVNRYFLDLVPILHRVRDALRPGGRFLLVVGDSLLAGEYVPGDLLLARIAGSIGFRIRSVEVARTRRSGQRRSFRLRESIVTVERAPTAP